MRKAIAVGQMDDVRMIVITQQDWRKDYLPSAMIPPDKLPECDGHVWTCYDGEDDITQIGSGFCHMSSRIGFYITARPVPDDTKIIVYCTGDYDPQKEY
jgi:hypothetical protein